MNKNILFIILGVIVVGGLGFWFYAQQSTPATNHVTNFEECVAAGNPIMESYPRQCRDGDAIFIEDISLQGEETVMTSADNAPEGSIHNLPVPEAVSAVKKHVAKNLGISEGLVIVMTAYEKTWSDSCLGLGGLAESCLQALVEGWEVTVQAQGKEYVYRTDATGNVIREETNN